MEIFIIIIISTVVIGFGTVFAYIAVKAFADYMDMYSSNVRSKTRRNHLESNLILAETKLKQKGINSSNEDLQRIILQNLRDGK